MMVLIFAQWCVNRDLDPIELYEQAYPSQMKNKTLQEQLSQTVPKNESEEITTEMVLYALQIFGNDDLAFVVQEAADKKTDGLNFIQPVQHFIILFHGNILIKRECRFPTPLYLLLFHTFPMLILILVYLSPFLLQILKRFACL